MTRKTHLLSYLLIASLSTTSANEALDLLEGRENESTNPANLTPPNQAETVADTNENNPSRQTTDFSERWQERLPPEVLYYEMATNPVIQRAALRGLAEWRYEHGNIDRESLANPELQDTEVDDNQLRRLRLGGMVRAFYNTDLEGSIIADGNGYQGIDRLTATIRNDRGSSLTFGKMRPEWSWEYRQDPSVLDTPEMSALVSQVAPANTLGIRGDAYFDRWDVGLGWYSADVDQNLPGFSGSGFLLANLAYTFQGESQGQTEENTLESQDNDQAQAPDFQRWRLDYIYNLGKGDTASIPNQYNHLLSTGVEISSGRFDFMGDFLLAHGDTNTAWGLVMLGRYWLLEDALQLVARYHYADTDDDNGIQLGYGVPSAIGDTTQPFSYPAHLVQTGDELHTFYAGLNWYLYNRNLVLQTGLEYRLLKSGSGSETQGEVSSWTWMTGGRVAF